MQTYKTNPPSRHIPTRFPIARPNSLAGMFLSGRSLLSEIEAAMLRHNLTATRFGQMAVQDGNFVSRLKAGTRPQQATIARVRVFLAFLDGGKLPVRRQAVENAIEALVGLLDAFDPDPDMEETGAEDDFCDHRGKAMADGPGCPIADTDFGIDDVRHDDDDPAEEDDPLELNGDEGDHSGDPHA